MGKIKGWEKLPSWKRNKIYYKNVSKIFKKTTTSLTITLDYNGNGQNYVWVVRNNKELIYIRKPTQKQAKEFAMNYMKEHPYG